LFVFQAEAYLQKALKKSEDNIRNGATLTNETKEDVVHSKYRIQPEGEKRR